MAFRRIHRIYRACVSTPMPMMRSGEKPVSSQPPAPLHSPRAIGSRPGVAEHVHVSRVRDNALITAVVVEQPS